MAGSTLDFHRAACVALAVVGALVIPFGAGTAGYLTTYLLSVAGGASVDAGLLKGMAAGCVATAAIYAFVFWLARAVPAATSAARRGALAGLAAANPAVCAGIAYAVGEFGTAEAWVLGGSAAGVAALMYFTRRCDPVTQCVYLFSVPTCLITYIAFGGYKGQISIFGIIIGMCGIRLHSILVAETERDARLAELAEIREVLVSVASAAPTPRVATAPAESKL